MTTSGSTSRTAAAASAESTTEVLRRFEAVVEAYDSRKVLALTAAQKSDRVQYLESSSSTVSRDGCALVSRFLRDWPVVRGARKL